MAGNRTVCQPVIAKPYKIVMLQYLYYSTNYGNLDFRVTKNQCTYINHTLADQ